VQKLNHLLVASKSWGFTCGEEALVLSYLIDANDILIDTEEYMINLICETIFNCSKKYLQLYTYTLWYQKKKDMALSNIENLLKYIFTHLGQPHKIWTISTYIIFKKTILLYFIVETLQIYIPFMYTIILSL
jgi:hypothetical protein